MSVIVGIDVGGSSQTAVAFDVFGEVKAQVHQEGKSRGGDDVLANLLSLLEQLGPVEIIAVGIGIPGQVDPAVGEVRTAVNLGIGDEPYPLAASLQEKLGCPVIVENDVRTAALGLYEELATGSSVTLVNIGTGIAAGVAIDGEAMRGAHGMAGEIGHLVMEENGTLCRCGQHGCLEAIAAGPAIARAWPAAEPSATALFAAAAKGDEAAQKIAGRVASHLATALTWLAATYDTEHVIIGGGVSRAGTPLLEAIRAEVDKRAADSEIAARRLRPSQITLVEPDSLAGPRGAWVLARRSIFERRESPVGTKKPNKGAAV